MSRITKNARLGRRYKIKKEIEDEVYLDIIKSNR